MKLIIAIIQPHRLDEVRAALGETGIQGMTVSEVRGYGRQRGQTEVYRGAEYKIHYVPKARIEVVVDDATAPKAVAAIQASARLGRIGDGKIFVLNAEQATRIRTGETGDDAL